MTSVEEASARPRSADIEDEDCHRAETPPRANLGRKPRLRKRSARGSYSMQGNVFHNAGGRHWPSRSAGITLPKVVFSFTGGISWPVLHSPR